MGEAKRRKNVMPSGRFLELDTEFRGRGIDTNLFGFYDDAAFVAEERRDARYLERYAEWVKLRPFDLAYERHARVMVPQVARLVAGALRDDDLQGGCITAAGIITRILDRLGIWSYGVTGALTLETSHPPIWRGLATVDRRDFPGAFLGHAWVAAPPFGVVDAAIALQHWKGDEIEPFVPNFVVLDQAAREIRPRVADVVSAEVRGEYFAIEGREDTDLHYRLEPNLRRFGIRFKGLEVTVSEVTLRYVPVAIQATDVGLELINAGSKKGRTGLQVWEEVVRPNLVDE